MVRPDFAAQPVLISFALRSFNPRPRTQHWNEPADMNGRGSVRGEKHAGTVKPGSTRRSARDFSVGPRRANGRLQKASRRPESFRHPRHDFLRGVLLRAPDFRRLFSRLHATKNLGPGPHRVSLRALAIPGR